MLTERDKMELRYLAKQRGPIWSGVRAAKERGDRITDESFNRFLAEGLIAEKGDGYIITNTGLAAIETETPSCPSCGKPL